MDLALLNNDVPFDILSRLPANILVELRSVSKGWQRIISHPDFIQSQIKRVEPISLSGFFYQERYEYCDIDIENHSYIPIGSKETKIHQNVLEFLPQKVVILASSNGLICCRSCISSPNPAIYICNPVNKEWITLKLDKIDKHDFIAFEFDPSSISTSHKLVIVSEVDNFSPGKEEFYFSFKIYDWEKKLWVKSKEVCHCEDSLLNNKWVLTNGILYWLIDNQQILIFEIENEFSLLISIPLPFVEGNCPEICLGESNGELHCIMVHEGALLIWVLVDRFSSKWDLKFSISLKLMEQENPKFLCNLVERVARSVGDKDPWMHPLAFKDGLLFLRVSSSAYSFHIHTRKMKWLCKMTDLGRGLYIAPTVVPYSMSLVPVANR